MKPIPSSSALLSIGTAAARYEYDQSALGRWMADSFGDQPPLRRWLKRLYDLSGIETRHTCLPDLSWPPSQSRFAPGRDLSDVATTAERMTIYQREAVEIGTAAAYRALADFDQSAQVSEIADTVTHLIVVSCTGFFAPGLDFAIAQRLNLRPTVARTLVGFMGCAAAFNGLRLASQIVGAQPTARVLVVCVELCSLHLQPGSNRINMVVGSLFADGAGACLVGSPPSDGADLFLLDSFYSETVPDTDHEMVWRIGDHGFVLHLSPDIPRHLGAIAPRALATLLDGRPTPRFWAIHPGGRAIVDRLAEIFALAPEQAAASLSVLRHYGNMSSPTVIFVLDELRGRLRRENSGAVPGVAMAFGPGLVVEMAHLSYLPPAPPSIEPAAEQRMRITEYVA